MSVGSTVEDAFRILGLPINASECDVKQAYKKMALRHHPDKNPGDSESHRQFIAISEAFQRISRSKHGQSKGKYKYNYDDYDDDEVEEEEDDDEDDDDEYYDDDDDDGIFQGQSDSIFEEMFRRMFFEGHGLRGRGGPSFSFNFGRRCDCPECRDQFRPKTPKMSEAEIAQARQERKERNSKTKAEKEAAAEIARYDYYRMSSKVLIGY